MKINSKTEQYMEFVAIQMANIYCQRIQRNGSEESKFTVFNYPNINCPLSLIMVFPIGKRVYKLHKLIYDK